MLIGGGSRSLSNPGRHYGGVQTFAGYRNNFHQNGAANNRYTAFLPTSGTPNGYRHPGAWFPPRSGGGLSAYTIDSGGDVAGSLVGGRTIGAGLSGAGDITGAALALIVSAVADLAGSGDLSLDLIGALQAAADLAGAGDVDAALGALAPLVADLTGSGSVASLLTGQANASADIVVTGELLNTANVAAAVWEAVAGAYNSPGTMGEKLNDAGSAANPWTEVIESGYTAAQILRLLAAAAAGKVAVDELTGEVTIRDLADTKDRIVAQTTDLGERTGVDLDAT